jgi:hypothetical protein
MDNLVDKTSTPHWLSSPLTFRNTVICLKNNFTSHLENLNWLTNEKSENNVENLVVKKSDKFELQRKNSPKRPKTRTQTGKREKGSLTCLRNAMGPSGRIRGRVCGTCCWRYKSSGWLYHIDFVNHKIAEVINLQIITVISFTHTCTDKNNRKGWVSKWAGDYCVLGIDVYFIALCWNKCINSHSFFFKHLAGRAFNNWLRSSRVYVHWLQSGMYTEAFNGLIIIIIIIMNILSEHYSGQ